MNCSTISQNMCCEKDLLQSLAHNNSAAFEILFNRYKNRIFSIAHKFTHCAITSEEIVQEVFLIVWLKRSRFSKVEHFNAYIFTITKNLVYKYLREKARHFITDECIQLTQSAYDAETLFIEKECGQVIVQAVKKLPLQQQKVYALVKEVGLKRNEAAKILHVSPDTIKFHLAQAMRNIKTYCAMYMNAVLFVLLLS